MFCSQEGMAAPATYWGLEDHDGVVGGGRDLVAVLLGGQEPLLHLEKRRADVVGGKGLAAAVEAASLCVWVCRDNNDNQKGTVMMIKKRNRQY